ncbi:hypothetical protein EU527_05080 [Candidatus Thorarchaeota archaeon]|nr:MAG: hypothetical protein EU527_05080 [Candidatus Thorarchaeota archaeon]
MSVIGEPTSSEDKVVARFTKYLNGPMGKTVLENLAEGESFILQTSEHSLRITKRHGRAVVTPLSFGVA